MFTEFSLFQGFVEILESSQCIRWVHLQLTNASMPPVPLWEKQLYQNLYLCKRTFWRLSRDLTCWGNLMLRGKLQLLLPFSGSFNGWFNRKVHWRSRSMFMCDFALLHCIFTFIWECLGWILSWVVLCAPRWTEVRKCSYLSLVLPHSLWEGLCSLYGFDSRGLIHPLMKLACCP